jgi:hypothetical protein
MFCSLFSSAIIILTKWERAIVWGPVVPVGTNGQCFFALVIIRAIGREGGSVTNIPPPPYPLHVNFDMRNLVFVLF